jgi:hypothetical protein
VSSLRLSDHPVLLSSLLLLGNSSDATKNGPSVHPTVPRFMYKLVRRLHWRFLYRYHRFIRWCPFFFFSLFFLPLKNRHLACGILASLGSRNVYKDMLNNMVSPIDHVVMNHQNKTRTNGLWGHVRYNLPLFGDLWQNKQSKHKFAKIDKIRTTYTCLDAYHHPNSPRSNFPLFWSSLSMFTHSLPLPTMEPLACFGPTFAPFGIKSPKSPKQKGSKETSKS